MTRHTPIMPMSSAPAGPSSSRATWSRLAVPALGLGSLGMLLLGLLAGCARSPADMEGYKRPKPPTTVTAAPVASSTRPKALIGSADPTTDWKPRESWAAQPIDLANIEPMQPPNRITVHHSGDPLDAAGEPEHQLRLFEKAHKAKGWACIGYHFIISRTGQVYEGRPLRYQGAHAGGSNNIGNIGICLIGNFDQRAIPDAQQEALERLIARLSRQYDIPRDDLHGHCHYKTTDCPGRYVLRWLEDYAGHAP